MSFLQIIAVSGLDSEKFLQGQLSCDMRRIGHEMPQLAVHCNVKGRVMSLFDVIHDVEGETFYLIIYTDLAEQALAGLQKYAVFSKVTLGLLAESAAKPLLARLYADLNLDDPISWRLARIKANIPTLFCSTSGQFLSHHIRLVELGAVSFTKGCYLGQEVIARMQHLGNIKQHMHCLRAPMGDCPQPGTAVYATADDSTQSIGFIVDAVSTPEGIVATATVKDSALPTVDLWVNDLHFTFSV